MMGSKDTGHELDLAHGTVSFGPQCCLLHAVCIMHWPWHQPQPCALHVVCRSHLTWAAHSTRPVCRAYCMQSPICCIWGRSRLGPQLGQIDTGATCPLDQPHAEATAEGCSVLCSACSTHPGTTLCARWGPV